MCADVLGQIVGSDPAHALFRLIALRDRKRAQIPGGTRIRHDDVVFTGSRAVQRLASELRLSAGDDEPRAEGDELIAAQIRIERIQDARQLECGARSDIRAEDAR